MEKRKSIKSKILFVVLLVISLAWIYPIFMIFINALKEDNKYRISVAYVRDICRIVQFCGCFDIERVCTGIWLQPFDYGYIRGIDSDLLFYVCMVYHTCQQYYIEDIVFPFRIFDGCTVPDADVYAGIYGR